MTVDTRLIPAAPDLAHALSEAPDEIQRRVAAMVADYAITETGHHNLPVARDALAALHANQHGDTPARTAVEDAGYAECAAGLATGDAGDDETSERHFIAGHALLAAAFALDDNAEIAAHEALYEATRTTKNIARTVKQRTAEILNGTT